MKPVWQTHLNVPVPVDDSYHLSRRREIASFFDAPPGVVVDVGCGAGATGRLMKEKFPGTRVIGVEINPAAAEVARAHLDAVVCADLADVRLDDLLGGEPVGVLLLLDVLEHLADPWRALERMRGWLAPTSRVIASVPNIRNLETLEQIAAGEFAYAPNGVLDVTHLRFFTRASLRRMFEETGYRVVGDGAAAAVRTSSATSSSAGRVASTRATCRSAAATPRRPTNSTRCSTSSTRASTDDSRSRSAPSGANAPCPCGSGLRYKHCHGATAVAPPAGRAAPAPPARPVYRPAGNEWDAVDPARAGAARPLDGGGARAPDRRRRRRGGAPLPAGARAGAADARCAAHARRGALAPRRPVRGARADRAGARDRRALRVDPQERRQPGPRDRRAGTQGRGAHRRAARCR